PARSTTRGPLGQDLARPRGLGFGHLDFDAADRVAQQPVHGDRFGVGQTTGDAARLQHQPDGLRFAYRGKGADRDQGFVLRHRPLPEIDWVGADSRGRRAGRAAVRGCRQVYHLAANPNLWAQQRGSFLQVNYQGTVNLLEEALQAGARRVLHTSTESILTR